MTICNYSGNYCESQEYACSLPLIRESYNIREGYNKQHILFKLLRYIVNYVIFQI
jgi:hypothetical protein